MPMDTPPEIDTTEESTSRPVVCVPLGGNSSLEGTVDIKELWYQLQKEIAEMGDVEPGSTPESILEKLESVRAGSDAD